MKLRPFQHAALDAMFTGFDSYPSQLLVMATGLGKTVVMSHAAQRWRNERRPGRVMLIAHREELIFQAKAKLDSAIDSYCDVEMAMSRDSGRSDVVVASVQTLSQPKRLAGYDPARFGLVMIDEAHHAVAGSYRRVLSHFRQNASMRALGVTATPKRADELAMAQAFDSCCFDYGIEPAVSDGWLVPVVQRAVRVQGLDFSRVKQVAGDLNEAELEQIMIDEDVLHRVVAPTIELCGDRPTLVFAVTVRHAHALAAILDRYKRGSAVALDGKTDKEIRREQVSRFKSGHFQFLVNCGLFLEGFDAPGTAAVVMARPTKSLCLYTQVLGRGTRPLPGVVDGIEDDSAVRRAAIAESNKPNMLVLDFVGNSGRHKIISAADVLGGKYGEPARKYAMRLSEDGKERSVGEVLEQATDELALLQEIRENERRRKIQARAQYDSECVSPFMGGKSTAGVSLPTTNDVTEKQVNYLVYRAGWKREAASKLSKRQASAIISRHRESEAAVK